MAVRTEKNGAVWTIVHERPEARNAMDPKSADALTAAFLEERLGAGLLRRRWRILRGLGSQIRQHAEF